jgi:hypothetical protein
VIESIIFLVVAYNVKANTVDEPGLVNGIDSIGDIFLYWSLERWTQLFCDNITGLYRGSCSYHQKVIMRWTRSIYRFIACTLSVCSVIYTIMTLANYPLLGYDVFTSMYYSACVLSGVIVTFPTIWMFKMINKLSLNYTGEYSETNRVVKKMALTNIVEQGGWIFLSVMGLIAFLVNNYNESNLSIIVLLGISVIGTWFIIHLQIIVFFWFLPLDPKTSPLFSESILSHLLLDAEDSSEIEMDNIHTIEA